MDIKEILNSEKGRTAQAQKIFAAKAAEMNITEFTKEECKTLRSWFKSEVIALDGFFATKAGNDALCHGLKNLQKGVKAKGVKDAQVGKQKIETPEVKKDAKGDQQAKGIHDKDFGDDAQQQGQDDAQQQGQDDAQQQGQDDAQQQGQDDAQQQGQDDTQQQGQDDTQKVTYEDLTESEKEAYW